MNETPEYPEPSASELLAKYLRWPGVLLPLLGLVTFVLYSGSLSFEFVWDDWPQIVNNPIIRTWSNLPRAFGSDLWYHVARHQVYYRPLFVVWSMLNFTLFGLRSWGWHLGAVLLHVGAVASVFWLARKLKLEYWTAALAALIFALHPIHVEPVAWISAASDTMVAMFVALAFVAFLSGRDPAAQKKTAWKIASWALLMCALLTKEMAVAFTALVAIYAWLNPPDKKASLGQRLRGAVIEALIDAEQSEHFLEVLAAWPVVAGNVARYRDVVARGEVRKQVEFLENETDGRLAEAGAAGVGEAGEILAGHLHTARSRRCEASNDMEQGRLPRAGRPHDREKIAGLHFQVDSAERRHVDLAHAVRLAEVLGLDDEAVTHTPAPRWGRAVRRSIRDRVHRVPRPPA